MSMPIVSDASALPPVVAKRSDEDEERANRALIYERYQDRVATLPKEKGWVNNHVYMYEGFWYPSKGIITIEAVMALQDTFKAHPTDIYLATLPKCGTTWLKALVFALVNRNKYKDDGVSSHPLRVSNPHTCVPYIETEIFKNTLTYVDAESPRLLATHIPYTSLPQSIHDLNCRLVYLCRNPKDVFVSTFHFTNKLRAASRGQMAIEEAFELFSKGIMLDGPYWDHVKGYYKASLEPQKNVLFLTYEDLTMDTMNNVKRIAKFLGFPFTEEEEAKGVVQEIIRLCSFKNLSETNKHGKVSEHIPRNVFFREGKVGDWSNHLSDEMSRILDEITKEKFHGLNISF